MLCHTLDSNITLFLTPSARAAPRSRQRRRHAPETLLESCRNFGDGHVVAAHLSTFGHLVNLVEPRLPI